MPSEIDWETTLFLSVGIAGNLIILIFIFSIVCKLIRLRKAKDDTKLLTTSRVKETAGVKMSNKNEYRLMAPAKPSEQDGPVLKKARLQESPSDGEVMDISSESIPTSSEGSETIQNNEKPPNKRVVGCFNSCSSTPITENQLKKLTHAVYVHDFLTYDGEVRIKTETARMKFEELKNKAKDTKVMISLGGESHFSELFAGPVTRRKLINSILSFLESYQIDGVDLFWKWPVASDKQRYSIFVKELRQAFLSESKSYILSVTSAPAGIPGYWPVGFDLEEMVKHVDFINIFSMDFYGPWGQETGPAAPLFYGVEPRHDFHVDYTVEYYTRRLANSRSKLNIVIPMDVRIWYHVRDLLEPAISQVYGLAESETRGVFPFGRIYNSRKQAEEAGIDLTNGLWDATTSSSFLRSQTDETLATFEDKRSVEAKLSFVIEKNLGGVWIRNVDMDDGVCSLMDTVEFDVFSKCL